MEGDRPSTGPSSDNFDTLTSRCRRCISASKVERLRHEIFGTRLQKRNRLVDRAEARHEDERGTLVLRQRFEDRPSPWCRGAGGRTVRPRTWRRKASSALIAAPMPVESQALHAEPVRERFAEEGIVLDQAKVGSLLMRLPLRRLDRRAVSGRVGAAVAPRTGSVHRRSTP